MLITDSQKLKDTVLSIAESTKFQAWAVERDYYLTLILNNIPALTDEIALHGSAAVHKIYLHHFRLSEDLDFSFYRPEALRTRATRVKAVTAVQEAWESYLKTLQLKPGRPACQELIHSRVYAFHACYPSFLTGREETIRVELSLRYAPVKNLSRHVLKHFYNDLSSLALAPHKILAISFDEIVSRKLYAAIKFQRGMANRVRDYYDLWRIAQTGFDFYDDEFIRILKQNLSENGYIGDYGHNFRSHGLKNLQTIQQARQILATLTSRDEQFELDQSFEKFKRVFSDDKYHWPRRFYQSLFFRKIYTVSEDLLRL